MSRLKPAGAGGDRALPDRVRDRRGAGAGDRHRPRLGNLPTVALAVALAFLFGHSLTMVPLLRSEMALAAVVPLASDTISIAIMEIVDNGVMLHVPGAMDAGLGSIGFWGALASALAVAFVAAAPVNRWLIAGGRGHAVVHAHHGG